MSGALDLINPSSVLHSCFPERYSQRCDDWYAWDVPHKRGIYIWPGVGIFALGSPRFAVVYRDLRRNVCLYWAPICCLGICSRAWKPLDKNNCPEFVIPANAFDCVIFCQYNTFVIVISKAYTEIHSGQQLVYLVYESGFDFGRQHFI